MNRNKQSSNIKRHILHPSLISIFGRWQKENAPKSGDTGIRNRINPGPLTIRFMTSKGLWKILSPCQTWGRRSLWRVIVINCKPRSERGEPNERFKSSECVCFKGVQLKRRAATDKGRERSPSQPLHLHYSRKTHGPGAATQPQPTHHAAS